MQPVQYWVLAAHCGPMCVTAAPAMITNSPMANMDVHFLSGSKIKESPNAKAKRNSAEAITSTPVGEKSKIHPHVGILTQLSIGRNELHYSEEEKGQ